ncbi:hypothetical protein AWP48_24870 [Escherichia coli]|nr:hypothetical protein AWP48_24870 [Escherichia coli]
MLGGADNPNGELPSYITGANRRDNRDIPHWRSDGQCGYSHKTENGPDNPGKSWQYGCSYF